MSERYTENLTTKTLRQFEEGDTLYITKNVSGYDYMYFCRFKRLERGIVVAEVIKSHRDVGGLRPETELRARASACKLYGKDEDDTEWMRFHRFRDLDTAAE